MRNGDLASRLVSIHRGRDVTMWRYVRLYLHFIRFSLSKTMAYRFDFWGRILMDTAYYAVSIGFYKVIFRQTAQLGGWNEHQALIFVATYLLADAIQMIAISENIWNLRWTVNSGDLDYYLLRPVSSLFFLSLHNINPSSVVNFLMALGLLLFGIATSPESISVWQLVLYSLFLLNGVFIYYLLRICIVLPVFWTHSGYGFDQLFFAVLPFMERPDGIFHGLLRKVLFTLLPFCLMASVPARVLFNQLTPLLALNVVIVTTAFASFVVLIWKRGLRAYASASS